MVDLTRIDDNSIHQMEDGHQDGNITLDSTVDVAGIDDGVDHLAVDFKDNDKSRDEEEGHNDSGNHANTVNHNTHNNRMDVHANTTNPHSTVGNLLLVVVPLSHKFTSNVELAHLLSKNTPLPSQILQTCV